MIPTEFSDRIEVVALEATVFEDRNGRWAKQWLDVVRVQCRFVDLTVTYLEPDDYRHLPKAQRLLIQHAPSSPLNQAV